MVTTVSVDKHTGYIPSVCGRGHSTLNVFPASQRKEILRVQQIMRWSSESIGRIVRPLFEPLGLSRVISYNCF